MRPGVGQRLPEGARPGPRPSVSERLGTIGGPTLVVVARHDPPTFTEVGRTAARPIPGAQLVEVDSDHYLTMRCPQEVGGLLLEFLARSVPPDERNASTPPAV
jgi:pimeloyl-ACP methyl ester carboxylesterase